MTRNGHACTMRVRVCVRARVCVCVRACVRACLLLCVRSRIGSGDPSTVWPDCHSSLIYE